MGTNIAAANPFFEGGEDRSAREYSRLVTRCVRRMYLRGAEYDDLYQEGMIALLKAMREFDPERSDNFEAFASVCISNRLYDYFRRKNPADGQIEDSFTVSPDPETEVLANESAKEIYTSLYRLLSVFEASVLGPYLEGFTVAEIAAELGRSPKSVDNAVRRIRAKLRKYLSQRR